MRLSASRIRSITRRLARAQGLTWPARDKNREPMPSTAPVVVFRTTPRIVKVVTMVRNPA